jgi:hypothetical protein
MRTWSVAISAVFGPRLWAMTFAAMLMAWASPGGRFLVRDTRMLS